MLAFSALSLGVRAAIVGATLLTFAGLYWGWHHHVYEQGYDAAIADVKAANTEGTNVALENVKKRRACRDTGGAWSQSRGMCLEP